LRLFIWKIAWNIPPTKERFNSVFSSTDIVVCLLCKFGEDSIYPTSILQMYLCESNMASFFLAI
jgi:hypothetical protein